VADGFTADARLIPGVRPGIWFRCPNGSCIRFPVLAARAPLGFAHH
jgi:hypothetical protein